MQPGMGKAGGAPSPAGDAGAVGTYVGMCVCDYLLD